MHSPNTPKMLREQQLAMSVLGQRGVLGVFVFLGLAASSTGLATAKAATARVRSVSFMLRNGVLLGCGCENGSGWVVVVGMLE